MIRYTIDRTDLKNCRYEATESAVLNNKAQEDLRGLMKLLADFLREDIDLAKAAED